MPRYLTQATFPPTCKGSIDKTPHHALVSGSSPSTPLSARPKGSQSTPVSSCERQLSSHSVGPKGSQLSARRLLDNTPRRDKARPVLHDVGNAPGLELPPLSPPPHGYVRSPSPYSLDPTPSPPSLPNVSGMAGEETPRRDRMEERSTFGTMAPSCLKTKVSDWLRKGGVALDRHKGCGGNASEDWDELAAGVEGGEEVGSVSPLERELRDMEEHYHRMEVDLVESPAPPPLGEGGASQGEGTHPDPPVSRPKRPRVVESAEEPVDTTVARVPRASQRGGLGEGGGGRVLTRAPACPHVSVTGTDGTRVYMKMATAAEEEGKVCGVCVCACVFVCVVWYGMCVACVWRVCGVCVCGVCVCVVCVCVVVCCGVCGVCVCGMWCICMCDVVCVCGVCVVCVVCVCGVWCVCVVCVCGVCMC